MNSKQPDNVVKFPKRATHKDDWWILHAPLALFKIKHGVKKGQVAAEFCTTKGKP